MLKSDAVGHVIRGVLSMIVAYPADHGADLLAEQRGAVLEQRLAAVGVRAASEDLGRGVVQRGRVAVGLVGEGRAAGHCGHAQDLCGQLGGGVAGNGGVQINIAADPAAAHCQVLVVDRPLAAGAQGGRVAAGLQDHLQSLAVGHGAQRIELAVALAGDDALADQGGQVVAVPGGGGNILELAHVADAAGGAAGRRAGGGIADDGDVHRPRR